MIYRIYRYNKKAGRGDASLYFQWKLEWGALADPLHQQLDVPPSTLEFEQKMADGLTLCIIHGVVTDAEGRNARKATRLRR